MIYASYDDCVALGCTLLDESRLPSFLHRASHDVDTLTFNRIVERGYESLSDFQREIVTEVTARLAEWEMVNSDLLDSPLSSYSVNGVTAQFGGVNVTVRDGVVMPQQLYGLLEQTGLCCRRL